MTPRGSGRNPLHPSHPLPALRGDLSVVCHVGIITLPYPKHRPPLSLAVCLPLQETPSLLQPCPVLGTLRHTQCRGRIAVLFPQAPVLPPGPPRETVNEAKAALRSIKQYRLFQRQQFPFIAALEHCREDAHDKIRPIASIGQPRASGLLWLHGRAGSSPPSWRLSEAPPLYKAAGLGRNHSDHLGRQPQHRKAAGFDLGLCSCWRREERPPASPPGSGRRGEAPTKWARMLRRRAAIPKGRVRKAVSRVSALSTVSDVRKGSQLLHLRHVPTGAVVRFRGRLRFCTLCFLGGDRPE
ncbi:sperm acrosome-associated protein 9 [Suricata suricatta]|uniref:sperm acrosome-associated protein 9 n=1 Tax=Suricata suricatta TaxID=37032 RepID=UPI0011558BFD|nr:sperm acrosome-associated protein 9 [Suricata suricatta]